MERRETSPRPTVIEYCLFVGGDLPDAPHFVIAKSFVNYPTPQIPQLRIALRVRLRAAPFAQDDIVNDAPHFVPVKPSEIAY